MREWIPIEFPPMSRQNHPNRSPKIYPWKKTAKVTQKMAAWNFLSFPFSDGGWCIFKGQTVDGHFCRGSRSPGKCHTHRRRNSEPTLVQFQLPKKHRVIVVVVLVVCVFFPNSNQVAGWLVSNFTVSQLLGRATLDDLRRWKDVVFVLLMDSHRKSVHDYQTRLQD